MRSQAGLFPLRVRPRLDRVQLRFWVNRPDSGIKKHWPRPRGLNRPRPTMPEIHQRIIVPPDPDFPIPHPRLRWARLFLGNRPPSQTNKPGYEDGSCKSPANALHSAVSYSRECSAVGGALPLCANLRPPPSSSPIASCFVTEPGLDTELR